MNIISRLSPKKVADLRKKYILTRTSINLFIMVVLILIFIVGIGIGNKIPNLIIKITWCLLLAILVNYVYKKTQYLKKSKLKSIYFRETLLYVIRTNKLFTQEVELNRSYITSSAVLSFYEAGRYLIILGHSVGNQYSKKVRNLDDELQGAFNMELEKKIDFPNVTEYYLLKKRDKIEQYKFTSDTFDKEFFRDIPVDMIKLTDLQSFSLKHNTNLGLYGRTGSGKTVGLQWYLYNAIAKGAGQSEDSQLSVVDGKGADLYALGEILKEELSNVSVGESPNHLAKISREFVEIMNARFSEIKKAPNLNADAYDLKMTPNFLFIDELASIRDSCGSTKEGNKLWNEILQNLGLIARKGRQAACHLILSTQDPNSENIPVELRNQITGILFLQSPSIDRIRMAFSMCELENIPTLSGQRGEALFYADGCNMIEPEITIVPFVDLATKEEFRQIINEIRRR